GRRKSGEHSFCTARLAEIYFHDLGMRLARAQDRHVSHAGQLQVINEVAFAGEKAQVFLSLYSTANIWIAHYTQLALFSEWFRFSTRSISCSKALCVRTRARCSRYSDEA